MTPEPKRLSFPDPKDVVNRARRKEDALLGLQNPTAPIADLRHSTMVMRDGAWIPVSGQSLLETHFPSQQPVLGDILWLVRLRGAFVI